MDLLPKYLNDLKDSKKPLRCNAYKKLSTLVSTKKEGISSTEAFNIIRSCIAGFEDASERCREEAVGICMALLDTQDHTILDWVLPAIVTRIGLETAVEESEEIRLLLLRLASKCMTCFPHDIGPRNFIDYFQVLLTNCYSDPYPELKKEACRATTQLCAIEPKQVSAISMPLAMALRNTCLLHKHATVRCEGVRTFACLVKHGASEVLSPGKTESESATTENGLFILANDHSEAVRLAVLQVISTALLDIKDRLEHHRRYLPHLLLLATDLFESVRNEAIDIINKLGKLYMLDNEDNRIDFSKRHVSMKDIEWYADDDYPDMTLKNNADNRYPLLSTRPSLGSRYVIAESARNFLTKLLADVTALDWVIPYSNNNRKAVSLRILWVLLFFSEKNSVQFAERVLGAVYKALRDDSPSVVEEASLCVEIIGKFLTPDQYLPFFINRPAEKTASTEGEEGEEDAIVHKSKTKTVVLTSVDAQERTKAPTLFSTEASTVKCSILYALRFLVSGSKGLLTPTHASQLAQALTSADILESESEEMLLALLSTLNVVFEVFAERDFISTPSKPLPTEVRDNVKQRTLDSIFLYALLLIKGSNFPSVRKAAGESVGHLSCIVTGNEKEIYALHARRILYRYGSSLPVQAFSDLILLASNKNELGEEMKNILVTRLGEVNFALRVTDELRYFSVLEQLLWDSTVSLSTKVLDELLRVVVLPLSAFNANHIAGLFRKIAINCLCAISTATYRSKVLENVTDDDSPLTNKIVTLWCSASDSDDSEMRLVCATALRDIVHYPMTDGTANELVQSIILRLDDGSDLIRLRVVTGLRDIVTDDITRVAPSFIKEVKAQMVPLTKKLLIYLDDQEETIGIRSAIEECLRGLGLLSPHVVIDLSRGAAAKHYDPVPCQSVVSYLVEKAS